MSPQRQTWCEGVPDPFDILVDSAGVARHAAFLDVSEADYRWTLDLNLGTMLFASQVCHKAVDRDGHAWLDHPYLVPDGTCGRARPVGLFRQEVRYRWADKVDEIELARATRFGPTASARPSSKPSSRPRI